MRRAASVRRVCQILRVLLLVVLWSPYATAVENVRSIKQFARTAWSAKDGAPSMIHALAQARDGYLWLGTPSGLYRFDGINFDRYGPDAVAKFASPDVSSLLALPDGDLWIGFDAGAISCLRGDRRTDYTSRHGVPIGRVLGLAQDAEGTIWAATTGGLSHLEGNRWRIVGRDWNFPGKSADAIFLDRQGTLWVATEDTIVFLPKGPRTFHETDIRVELVDQIAEAPSGKLWIDEVSRSVRPVPLGRSKPPSDRSEIRVGSHAILFDKKGALWITTTGDGLRRVALPTRLAGKPGRFSSALEAFTSRDGLTNDFVRSILQDREGNIWVGTPGGLDRFRETNLVQISLPIPAQTTTLVAGGAGDLWAAGEGLVHVQRGHAILIRDSAKWVYIFTGCCDVRGGIWWAAVKGIFHFSNGRFSRFALPYAVNAANIETIQMTEDRSRRLWAAVEGAGLSYLRGKTWQRFNITPELAKLEPTAAFTDLMGRVCFGYKDGSVLDLETKGRRTLLMRHDSQVGIVRTIRGRGQHLWIGGDFGLAFFDGTSFRKIMPSDSVAFGCVSGIEETSDGSLWLAATQGVVQITGNEVRKSLEDPAHRVSYKLVDSLDGLPGTFQNIVRGGREVQTRDGRLWFVATNGVAWINPARVLKNSIAPPVSIRSLEANGTQYDTATTLTLPPMVKRLHISFSAMSLSIPKRLHFRYRLEGVDKNWEEADNRRDAYYTTLAPGKYQFHVIASNNDGIWNNRGAFLDFRIQPAWYQTVLFKLLLLIIGLGVILTLYPLDRQRYTTLLRIRFDERLEERTRLARELHDTLLQTIQGSKLVADHAQQHLDDPGITGTALQRISQWLDRVVVEGRSFLDSLRHSTRDTEDLPLALKRAAETCGSDQMKITVSVIGLLRPMHPVARYEVFRIGSEAIRNACAHSGGGSLIIELLCSRDLILNVRDSGRGFDPKLLNSGKPGHFGIMGMRERASSIGGRLSLHTVEGRGTCLTLTVPGEVIFRSPALKPFFSLSRVRRSRNGSGSR
jgi:signal transduction histidine kinase/ligand-binding sensor domain-containing protein